MPKHKAGDLDVCWAHIFHVLEGLAQFWPITLGQSTYLSTFPKGLQGKSWTNNTIIYMYLGTPCFDWYFIAAKPRQFSICFSNKLMMRHSEKKPRPITAEQSYLYLQLNKYLFKYKLLQEQIKKEKSLINNWNPVIPIKGEFHIHLWRSNVACCLQKFVIIFTNEFRFWLTTESLSFNQSCAITSRSLPIS